MWNSKSSYCWCFNRSNINYFHPQNRFQSVWLIGYVFNTLLYWFYMIVRHLSPVKQQIGPTSNGKCAINPQKTVGLTNNSAEKLPAVIFTNKFYFGRNAALYQQHKLTSWLLKTFPPLSSNQIRFYLLCDVNFIEFLRKFTWKPHQIGQKIFLKCRNWINRGWAIESWKNSCQMKDTSRLTVTFRKNVEIENYCYCYFVSVLNAIPTPWKW